MSVDLWDTQRMTFIRRVFIDSIHTSWWSMDVGRVWEEMTTRDSYLPVCEVLRLTC